MVEEKYTVKQIKKGKFYFQIHNPLEREYKIYRMKSPDGNNNDDIKKELIATTNAGTCLVDLDNIDYRPYFLLQSDEEAFVLAERTLPVGGMNNFRDMGGYPAKDGKHVRWGRLYRSDHIHNANPEGMEYLKKLNIHTIIDYRSTDEVNKYPNHIIEEDVQTYQLDPAAHTAELSAQFTSSKENEDANLVSKIIEQKEKGLLVNRYDMVMEQYQNFVEAPKAKKAFEQMLKALAEPFAPAVVQHCRGGKDRTGFGALLLLGVLGVERDYIIWDYMLTQYNRIDRNNVKKEIYKTLTEDEEVLDYLMSLIETKPEFIMASLDLIEEKYSSIENYVRTELNIGEDTITDLKHLYLE